MLRLAVVHFSTVRHQEALVNAFSCRYEDRPFPIQEFAAGYALQVQRKVSGYRDAALDPGR